MISEKEFQKKYLDKDVTKQFELDKERRQKAKQTEELKRRNIDLATFQNQLKLRTQELERAKYLRERLKSQSIRVGSTVRKEREEDETVERNYEKEKATLKFLEDETKDSKKELQNSLEEKKRLIDQLEKETVELERQRNKLESETNQKTRNLKGVISRLAQVVVREKKETELEEKKLVELSSKLQRIEGLEKDLENERKILENKIRSRQR